MCAHENIGSDFWRIFNKNGNILMSIIGRLVKWLHIPGLWNQILGNCQNEWNRCDMW